jgi:hypothetical protein
MPNPSANPGNGSTGDNMPDNAFIEAFNGRFRSECLNAHWFLSLADAQGRMEDWRKYYNEERPPWGDRPQSANHVVQSRWRSQPAAVTTPTAIQRWVSLQTRPPLADLICDPKVSDGFSPGGGRHHFFEAISFSIALSSNRPIR